MAYGDAMGYLPFREAIAEYLGAVRGVRCEASQILVTTGSQQALQISAQVLLDPKDRVCMEEPGYPGARQAFITVGAQLIPIRVDHDGMNVAEILRRGRDARAVYVTPSHQYPMGMTMSAARRMLLLNWAARSGAWIIEDDYDRVAARPGHGWEGHLYRNVQQGHVSSFAPRLRGRAHGFDSPLLCRSGCYRHLFVNSLSGCLDRFHRRGTLCPPHTSDANALYGSA